MHLCKTRPFKSQGNNLLQHYLAPQPARLAHVWSAHLTQDTSSARACVCVCVSHPGSKGFPRSHLSTVTRHVPLSPSLQGAGVPLQVSCQRRRLQLAVKPDLISLAYLRTIFELLTKPFPIFPRCFHGGSCYFPQTIFLARCRC